MTDPDLKKLAAEYLDVSRAIAKQAKRLKALKKVLIDEAKTRKYEQVKAVSGGWSLTIIAKPDGSIVRVIKAGRAMVPSFGADHDDLDEIRELAGADFSDLFEAVTKFIPVEDFREEAADALPEDAARALIRLCTKPGTISVSSETKAANDDEED